MNFGGLIGGSGDSVGMGARIVADTVPHRKMPDRATAQPSPSTSPIPKSVQRAPALSLSFKRMDGHGDVGLIGENFDPAMIGRMRDDGYESTRSGSENFEGASGDDQDAGDDEPPRKKKYHRHTPLQIQELETFFKDCPHPDEKQRLDLSRKLGLETKQIKFWFQNRRTQMKTQLERHENVILRQENDKLRAENDILKQAMGSPICNTCGGPAVPGEISYEQHQLRIENARLKDELGRICALTNKFLGRPITSSASPCASQALNSNLELGVGRNGFGGLTSGATTLPLGLDQFGDGPVMSEMKSMGNETSYDRSAVLDVAVAAMDELLKMVQMDGSLWIKSLDRGKDTLNHEDYMRTFFPFNGIKPAGYVTEGTRDSGLVIINSLALVELMMDTNRWAEMFPCMIAKAVTIDVLSTGTGGSRNNALQVMHAEFQVLSPLVPIRQVRFLRYCRQHAEGLWAVVDVSIDTSQEVGNADMFPNCRRLPSGIVIQEMPNGCSKVTWIEHSEYDDTDVHHLFRPLISSGLGFGAPKWIATLQRRCECLAMFLSSSIPGEEQAISPAGKKSMLKLAQRMTYNFCSGVCISSARKWDKLRFGNVDEDVKVMSRKNMNDPGEPPGVVLSAATSVWMPISRHRLFDFLRDERMRSEWDILSNGGPMQQMIQIPKGQGPGNCVSLLRGNAINSNDSGMLILQETWTDDLGSFVVYAPVDISSIGVVMNGGDSTYVALLPSGFAILPSVSPGNALGKASNGTDMAGSEDRGCLLTVGFQILVNSLPTAKLTMESVETVNNLISCTIQKIKTALLQ